MMRLGTGSIFGALFVGFGLCTSVHSQDTNGTSDFSEVYNLIREHVNGLSPADLDRAAVHGLVSALAPKVSLVKSSSEPASSESKLVTKTAVFEDDIAYIRVRRVEDGLAQKVREACEALSATNKLKGLVLDLRYAQGQDYPAVETLADYFVKKEQPLLDWGNGMVNSKQSSPGFASPVAVLVNGETAGSSEALAAVLRQTGTALILGSKTAGQAAVAQEFPLKNGDLLRIATAPIQLGDGTLLGTNGVKPDITVNINPQDERAYYNDAFKDLERSNLLGAVSTNQPGITNLTARRTRFNEAELVRERKEGTLPDSELVAESAIEAEPLLVRDPALARALDVLKGLALVRQAHP